jgi:DNA polymerase-3 subunit delta'
MGSAEPANAFLKTLEEPPDQTVIFLLTENPEALLPTIISRCLWLPVKMQEQVAVDEHTQIAVDAWFNVFAKHPADRAYMRASAVASAWSEKRMALDQAYKESARKASSETESELEEDADEKVVDAQLESDFIQWRERVLKQILRHDQNQELPLAQRQRVIECIEELRQALGRNLDPAFALERCCLKLEGLIA